MKPLDGYETLYRKVGRKYEAIGTARDMHHRYENLLKAGQWRMEYCPRDGRGRYWYEVKPDTASFCAAAMLAEDAMLEAIDKARLAKVQEPKRQMTRSQQKAFDKAQAILAEAGLLDPQWWTHRSAYEIVKAGFDAIKNYRA